MNNVAGVLTKKESSLGYKTGSWKTLMPVVDMSKCIHCMLCVVNCPENCIKVKEDVKLKVKLDKIDLDYCKGCKLCSDICPVKCISMEEFR